MGRSVLRRMDYWEKAPVGLDDAIQNRQVWLTESCTTDVEIRLSSNQQSMPFKWKYQVRALIEGRLENRPISRAVIRLRFAEIFK